jgi:ectoine hydroxylase-related dioxygenase (phytanoyl-CoA dioxygenase family)
MNRFSELDVAAWREDGFALVPDFFSAQELAPVVADYERLYGTISEGSGQAIDEKEPGDIGALGEFRDKQFKNIDTLPYEGSEELNLLSLHPALISFSRALLGVDDVQLYQSHTWAKYTGETDYDQDFHCDFSNHTLVVPSDDQALRTVDFIIYLTDVTDELGALHYVPKQKAADILGDGRIGAFDPSKQVALKAVELSAASPAGTLVAHSIDTFHRGTNLTQDKGYRFTMTVGYKAAGNDMIAYHVWQQTGNNDWSQIMSGASPEQLRCLGIPEPGHPFWTTRTLKLTRARWPEMNMAPYFAAAGVAI